jgi:hypothetical protein
MFRLALAAAALITTAATTAFAEGGKPEAPFKPAWAPLTSAEIVRHISGRGLTVDADRSAVAVVITGCFPTEVFRSDGAWEMRICARMPSTLRGRWRASDDRLCVVRDSGTEECNRVWFEQKSERLIISVWLPQKQREVFNFYSLSTAPPRNAR